MRFSSIAKSLRAIARRSDSPRWKRWHGAVLSRIPALLGLPFGLNTIGLVTGTDKAAGIGQHAYLPIYEPVMRVKRLGTSVRLLEIGVGGYERWSGGRSCYLWRLYFPFAKIFAVDLYDKTELTRGRIRVLQGSQADVSFLTALGRKHGPFDFVIDDGSHVSSDQIASFEALFPFVKPGGMYAVEDLQTSYQPAFGGAPVGHPCYRDTTIAYLKDLVDSVNRQIVEPRDSTMSPMPHEIASIEFHKDLSLIHRRAAPVRREEPVGGGTRPR